MKYGILKWWKDALFFGIRLYEGEEGGGGDSGNGGDGGDSGSGDGGNGAEKEFTKTEMEAAISAALEKETSGLKAKNQELIGSTKKLSDKLSAYGDLDPQKVKDMMKQLENEDDAKLLADGKIEDLVQKRLDKEAAKWNDERTELNEQINEYKSIAETSDRKYNDFVVEQQITKAALTAGIRPEAIDDVVAVAAKIFTVGEDSDIEARDSEGNLRRLGEKLFTPASWLDSLRETKPHYWPVSAGAGAQGNQGGKGGNAGDLDARIAAAADAGDHATYRKLRQQKANTK